MVRNKNKSMNLNVLTLLVVCFIGCSFEKLEDSDKFLQDEIGYFDDKQIIKIKKLQKDLESRKNIMICVNVQPCIQKKSSYNITDKSPKMGECSKKNRQIYLSIEPDKGITKIDVTKDLTYSYYIALMSNKFKYNDSFANSHEALNNIERIVNLAIEEFEDMDSVHQIGDVSLNDLVEFRIDEVVDNGRSTLDFLKADFGGGIRDTMITVSGRDTIKIEYLFHQRRYFRELIESMRVGTYIIGRISNTKPLIVSLRSERVVGQDYYREPRKGSGSSQQDGHGKGVSTE